MPALLNVGIAAVQGALKTLVTHVGVSDDSTAFASTQTRIDPSGTGTNVIKTASKADVTVTVTNDAFDATITLDASTDTTLVGKSIRTISLMSGSTATNAISRTVRGGSGINFQSGDVFTIGVRAQAQDNSP